MDSTTLATLFLICQAVFGATILAAAGRSLPADHQNSIMRETTLGAVVAFALQAAAAACWVVAVAFPLRGAAGLGVLYCSLSCELAAVGSWLAVARMRSHFALHAGAEWVMPSLLRQRITRRGAGALVALFCLTMPMVGLWVETRFGEEAAGIGLRFGGTELALWPLLVAKALVLLAVSATLRQGFASWRERIRWGNAEMAVVCSLLAFAIAAALPLGLFAGSVFWKAWAPLPGTPIAELVGDFPLAGAQRAAVIVLAERSALAIAVMVSAALLLIALLREHGKMQHYEMSLDDFMSEQAVFGLYTVEKGVFSSVNQALADLLGYAPEDLIGKMSPIDIVCPADRPRAQAALERRFRGDVIEGKHYYTCLKRDGTEMPIVHQGRVVWPEGEPVMMGVVGDLSGEVRARHLARDAQESLHRQMGAVAGEAMTYFNDANPLLFLSEQTAWPVMMVSPEGRVLYLNPAMARLLNVERESLGGMILAADGNPLLEKMRDQLNCGQAWEGPLCFAQRRWEVDIRPVRLPHAPILGFTLLARTDEQPEQAEQVGAGPVELERTAVRHSGNSLAEMTHELRTPLNAIIGFSDLMLREIWGELGNPRYRGYVGDIKTSADHLLSLVNDVLDRSALESGQLTLHEEWIALAPALETALQMVTPRAMEARLTLSCSLQSHSFMVLVDERRLRQILLNLLSNAVKFTPEGGTVAVLAQQDPKTGEALIAVRDSGVGMDEKGVEMAKKRYGRVASAQSKRWEGTGLGLPLAFDLCRLHGGDIRIDSTPNVGTTMTLHLPPHRVQIVEELSGEMGAGEMGAGEEERLQRRVG